VGRGTGAEGVPPPPGETAPPEGPPRTQARSPSDRCDARCAPEPRGGSTRRRRCLNAASWPRWAANPARAARPRQSGRTASPAWPAAATRSRAYPFTYRIASSSRRRPSSTAAVVRSTRSNPAARSPARAPAVITTGSTSSQPITRRAIWGQVRGGETGWRGAGPQAPRSRVREARPVRDQRPLHQEGPRAMGGRRRRKREADASARWTPLGEDGPPVFCGDSDPPLRRRRGTCGATDARGGGAASPASIA